MALRSIGWHYLLTFIIVVVLMGAGLFFFAVGGINNALQQKTRTKLKEHTRRVITRLEKNGTVSNTATDMDSVVHSFHRFSDIDCEIISPDGVILGTSIPMNEAGYTSLSMPEIQQALDSDTATAIRYSSARQQQLVFIAVPITERGKVTAVVHTFMPVIANDVASVFYVRSFFVLLGAMVLGLMAFVYISAKVSRSFDTAEQKIERFGLGDLSPGYEFHNVKETAQLSRSLNEMAVQIDTSIKALVRQKNERKAIFSAMVEGVVAVDNEEKIILMNEAAAHILDVSIEEVRGKWVQQVIRSSELQEFVRRLLNEKVSMMREITFSMHFNTEKTIEVQGNVLADETSGVIFVLHDITHLKKLENIRKEFVANVSHELRTPVTTIKGFVETLLGGAADTEAERTHFLNIIEKHVNRLNSLIDDLMAISRLEKDNLEVQLQLETTRLDAVVANALEVISPRAKKRDIKMVINGEENLRAKLDSSLFEQALINLVDNAIKYSEPGTSVYICKRRTEKTIEVSVKDEGQGIKKENIPRLFERFYRVDKARSRNMGGTGLGLSIVKHIVSAHRGTILVNSTPGKGSTFTVVLPNNSHKENV